MAQSSKNASLGTIGRRGFVKGAAAGLGMMVAGGLSANSAGAAEAATAQAPADAPAWLGEEPQITAKDIVATDTCDVLIVGLGCAGIAAAATASDMGLNFIGCDKAPVVPETREYVAAVNSSYIRDTGYEVDKGKIANEISRYASGKCDRNLVKLWVDQSAEMIDWIDPIMEAAGKPCEVDMTVAADHATGGTDYYMPAVQHCWLVPYYPPLRNELLCDRVLKQGGDLRFGYEMVRLVHEGGTVRGAIFKTTAGYVEIDAQATLIATGGYPANAQMMRALQTDACRVITANSYNTFDDGSGIKAGMWAGAIKQADPTPMLFDRGAVDPGVDAGYGIDAEGNPSLPGKIYQLNWGSQPFLKVNREGERFANESTPYDNMLFATERQPGGVFCQIFDSNAPADVIRFNMIGCASYSRMMMEQGVPLDDFLSNEQLGFNVVKKADTLDELADLLGFADKAKETFLATCERYNELYDAQQDTDYGKEAYRLSELRTPPFYGCWYGASLLTTLDGLVIDSKMRVVDAAWRPIPGLYAAGDASGSFFNTNYPEYIPGLAAGRSVVEGRQFVMGVAADPAFTPTAKTPSNVPSTDVDLSALTDGTYTGTAKGMGGDISVTIDIKDGRISVDKIGPNHETPGIGGYEAIEDGTYAAQIEAAQSDAIDGVAGATITSAAVKSALHDALAQAAK